MTLCVAPDEPIRLVAPDPDWPAWFERERGALEAAKADGLKAWLEQRRWSLRKDSVVD